MQITGTTLTGCTLGPYYDPGILYGFTTTVVPYVYSSYQVASTTLNPVLPVAYNTGYGLMSTSATATMPINISL